MSKWIRVEAGVPNDGKLVAVVVDHGGVKEVGAYIWRNPAGPVRDFFYRPYTKRGIVMWCNMPEAPDELDRKDRRIEIINNLIAEQAEDEGLWFMAETAPEAYLQQELRRLHAALDALSEDN